MTDDNEPDKHPDPEVDKMQDDVIALIQAWQDRGISLEDCAQLLTTVGHEMLIRLDCSFGEMVIGAARQWEDRDGVV